MTISNAASSIQPSCVVVTPPATASQPVPTLSSLVLAVFGMALAFAAIRLLRG